MYIYDRQFSGHAYQREEQPFILRPSRNYTLLGESSAKTFSSRVLITTPPDFKSIPITLENLRPQEKGKPFILQTLKSFKDIATLRGLTRKLRLPPGNLEAEFSIGQALLDTGIFKPDPNNVKDFQIPFVQRIAYPADPADSGKLAQAEKPFPVVLIAHGQHDSYRWYPRRDAQGGVITKPVSGSQSPRFEFFKLEKEIESFRGFEYLQMDLASYGIVSVSINNNPANIFDNSALLKVRSDLILAHLDHLQSLSKDPQSPFFQKLNFNNVGLLGNSRGGDAVVKAVRENKKPFGIKAVVSLSPLDQTGLLEPEKRLKLTDMRLHYLVVYGSHDGDISGNDPVLGTGFRHYDRATCPRSMLFIHGATHNRFNSVWDDECRVKNEIASGKAGIDRILTRDEHESLAKEYIGGWFRMALNSEAGLTDLFNGTRLAGVKRGPLTVSTQWNFGKRIRFIDDSEGPNPGQNRLKGQSTATPNKSIIRTSIGLIGAQFPHQTKVLMASRINAASSTFRTEIPKGTHNNRDFRLFDLLTFRMTKMFDAVASQREIDAQPFPRFRIRLKDGRGESATVDHTAIYAANPHAPTHPYHRVDWGEPCLPGELRKGTVVITLNPLETLSVPLPLFSKANSKIDLGNVRFLEFEFMSVQQDQIFIDDLQLIKR